MNLFLRFIKIEKSILFRLGSFFKSIIYSSIHIHSFVDLLCESTSEKDKIFKIKKNLVPYLGNYKRNYREIRSMRGSRRVDKIFLHLLNNAYDRLHFKFAGRIQFQV